VFAYRDTGITGNCENTLGYTPNDQYWLLVNSFCVIRLRETETGIETGYGGFRAVTGRLKIADQSPLGIRRNRFRARIMPKR